MRLLLFLLTLLSAVSLQAQLSKRPQFYHVSYAVDTVFKKPAPSKTILPGIAERSMQTTQACNPGCNPLPVKFLSLKAERRSELKVAVQWQTVNEINAKGYDVERSLGDPTHFEKVGFVTAKGNRNEPNAYLFNDVNDFSGVSYYRLKQLDDNNKYAYSKTVAVKGFSKEEKIEGYPNPAHMELQLTLSLTKPGEVKLFVFDAVGRMVQQQTSTLSKGSNLVSIAVNALMPGTYFIRTVTPAEKTLFLQFVKN